MFLAFDKNANVRHYLHRGGYGERGVGNHKQSLRTVGVMANGLWIGKITRALRWTYSSMYIYPIVVNIFLLLTY